MRKRLNRKGFTMAEVLIVVAIIVVLAGVGFVALVSHMRNMHQLEMDGHAKEIFVAAQNHLSMAKSQEYLGVAEYETTGGVTTQTGNFGNAEDANNGIYYIVVKNAAAVGKGASLLEQMLPFASVDEKARAKGCYIIRYQKDPGIVLDVFYSEPAPETGSKRYSHTLTAADYETLMSEAYHGETDAQRKNRRKFGDNNDGVIGWYGGGTGGIAAGEKLETPGLEIINGDRLLVKVTDYNSAASNGGTNELCLIITSGEISLKIQLIGATAESDTNSYRVTKDGSTYTVVLDDVTTTGKALPRVGTNPAGNLHFAALTNQFTAGSDIQVSARAYNNTVLTNIAETSKLTTNSLFASLNSGTGEISSIRHLLNLDPSISNLAASVVSAAKQTSDLNWADFLANTRGETTQIYNYAANKFSENGSYMPVSPVGLNSYEGQGGTNRVIGIVVSGETANAGLFGTLSGSVSDLELIDFKVSSSGNAGALAGATSGSPTITAVLVHNSKTGGEGSKTSGADIGYKIESTNAAAGGLVGSLSGGTVNMCAAAVYVKGATEAGGLIGSAASGSVTSSYSGGHTEDAQYVGATEADPTLTVVNVIVTENSGYAGGLVGYADETRITNCYSTSSAAPLTGKSATVGGLVGSTNGGTITSCYSIGYVAPGEGGTASSFIGLSSGTNFAGTNMFLESGEYNNSAYESVSNVTAASAGVGSDIIVPDNQQGNAYPYDKKLLLDHGKTVNGKQIVGYCFKNISQLVGASYSVSTSDAGLAAFRKSFLESHYGDWQLPGMIKLDYKLVNEDTLYLEIALPASLVESSGGMFTMAVTGAASTNTRMFIIKATADDAKTKVASLTLQKEGYVDSSKTLQKIADLSSLQTKLSARFTSANKTTVDGKDYYNIRITLDDITTSTGHFAQLFACDAANTDKNLWPGENITVRVAGGECSFSELSDLDYWDKLSQDEKDKIADKDFNWCAKADNSLYFGWNDYTGASHETYVDNLNSTTIYVKNLRHLQNLDSSTSYANILGTAVTRAELLNNIDYNTEKTRFARYAKIYNYLGTASVENAVNGIYNPQLTSLSGISYAFDYTNGKYNKNELKTEAATLSNFAIKGTTDTYARIYKLDTTVDAGNTFGSNNAGLFRYVKTGASLTVADLYLEDPTVSGSDYVGAVVASNHGTVKLDTVLVAGASASVVATSETATSSIAGGLVGYSGGNGTKLDVINSAATVLIKSNGGPAGGLLGRQNGGTVQIYASYVGGHTKDGKYYVGDSADGGTSGRWNIISLKGAAGGLIGEIASGTTGIEKTFNAASVYSGNSSNAGGVAGVANGAFAGISNLKDAEGTVISTSGNVLELVYTVAPVNSVGTWGYDSDNLRVLDTTIGSGTNGAVFGNLAAGSAPSAPNLYYLADIYDDAKFNEAVTESTIKYFGTSTNDMSVRLASYYADENDANSSRDIIAVLSSSYAGLQRQTTAYDAALREEDEEKEYPFAIWTTFTFDNVNGLHFYGDWQPVDSKNSSMFKFYFLREAPEDAAEGAASYPLAEFEGDTSSVRLPIRLIPFSSRELAIPTVPYIPGYTYGNGTDSSANGYYVWTVYYGDLSDKTSESEMSSALVTYRKAVGGELQNVPLTYKESGESILLQNTDEINIQKILTEAQNNHESSFTLVAHYVSLPNTYTLRLMDYSTGDDSADYKHLGNIQTMTVNPETGLTLGAALSGEQIDIPARSSKNKDYQFLGWYTQPDVKASDGTISNSGERVFYFENGELQLDHDQAVTGHITLYAHYGKIDWGEITLKFILVDEEDNTTELGDGYPIRFDKNQGLDLDVTLPGTVMGVKINKKTGSSETTICDEEHSNLHTNTLEAYFKAKSGSTTQDESAHIKTGVLTTYPDEYDVYIKGTVNTVYYALVHVLSNTGNKDTLAYADGSVTYSVEYVPMFENTSPVVDQSKYVSASLAGFGMENPTVTSAKSGSTQYDAMISAYGKDGLNSTYDEKDVKYIFVLTYPRDQHYLIYTNTGDTDIDPELVYYGQSIQTVVDAHGAEQMNWYGYQFSKWVRLDGTNEVDITDDDKMQDTNVTVKAKWSGDPTKYTILVWLQNADDDEYTQQGKLTDHQAPAGETLVVTPSTNGFVITTETMTDGDQISLTSISSLSELSRYIHYGTAKMQAEKPVEVRGDESTILNVYYDRNVYTLRFDIGFAVASDWQYLPVSATEAIASHETYYKKIGNGPNDYEPIKLEYTVNSERQSYNGYRYQVTTAGTGEQWGIIDSQAKQITSAQWTVFYWERKGNSWHDISDSVLYTRTGNGPGATYTDSGKTTESAFADRPDEGAYYYLNGNQYQTTRTKPGEKGKETVWTNNNQQYTGERYTRVNADSTNESYNLGFVDGKMVRLKHDSQGWYYETETYQFKNYTGDVYLLKSNTADYYVSNITSTNQGGNDDYEHFLTQKRVKVSGNDHKNPFNLKDYEGTYRTNTQYKIYYNDITARYGEHIFDEWPAVFPDVSEGDDKFYFVGWITPSDAWYWCGVATDSHKLAAPKSSIKGKIDIMNWKIVDVKASNAYTSRPVTADGDVSLEFHCRYAKHGSGAPWSYVYRQFFWDPGYGTSGGYHENPDIAYVINAGNGSDPQKQADLEFYGYDRVGKDVYITTATPGTNVGYHDVQDFYNTGTNFPHANNRQNFTVDGETVSAVEIRYRFMPHQKTMSFRYGGDLTRAISGVADVSKYYDQPLAGYATTPPAVVNYTFEYEWYLNEECLGDPYLKVIKDSDDQATRDAKTAYNAKRKMPDGDLTLYAKMKHDPITVIFKMTDGVLKDGTAVTGTATPPSGLETTASFSVIYGSTLHEEKNLVGDPAGTLDIYDAGGTVLTAYSPTLANYTFKGWCYYDSAKKKYEKFSYVHTVKESLAPSGTLTLVPMWEVDSVGALRPVTISYILVDYDDVILNNALVPAVTAYWRDTNGNIILEYSDSEQDSATAEAAGYKRIRDGDRVTIQAREIDGKSAVEPSGTIYSVSETDHSIILRYRDTSWSYNVEYYVLYENLEKTAGWVSAYIEGDEETTLAAAADFTAIKLNLGEIERTATSQYAFFDEMIPTGATIDLSSYCLHHYEFGKTEKDDDNNDVFVVNDSSYANYIIIHPEIGNTLRVYLYPDPDAITVPDLVTYYDGTRKDTKYATLASEMSAILDCPTEATAQLTYVYYYYDKTTKAYVRATTDKDVVNADTYGVRAFMTVTAKGKTYLVWQSDLGSTLANVSVTVGNKTESTPPLHLYVQRRFVLVRSWDANNWEDQYATYYDGEVLRCEEIYYDTMSNLYGENPSSRLEAYYSTLEFLKDGVYAEGLGVVDGESLRGEFSAEAFRRNDGVSPNVFTCVAGANTDLSNYSIYVLYGSLTVR